MEFKWTAIVHLLFLFLFHGHTSASDSNQLHKDNSTRINMPDTASVGRVWSTSDLQKSTTADGWSVPVLTIWNSGPSFACGLICNYQNSGENSDSCDSIYFSVLIVYFNSSTNSTSELVPPVIVWTANRNSPALGSAKLNFTLQGQLILQDSSGDAVWSANTSASDIAGMKLTNEGNLVLYDRGNDSVWQSFKHPTDTVLLKQSLTGMQLVSNLSATNCSEGHFILAVNDTAYFGFVKADSSSTPQMYYSSVISSQDSIVDGGVLLPRPDKVDLNPAMIFKRLELDGQLMEYDWSEQDMAWNGKGTILQGDYRGYCTFPLVCGSYGYCLSDDEGKHCSCARSFPQNESYFEPVDPLKSTHDCTENNNLSCSDFSLQPLVDYGQLDFYEYKVSPGDITGVDLESCKRACETQCDCRGAFFKYWGSLSNGDCYLPSAILTVTMNDASKSKYNSSVFLKVQMPGNGTSVPLGTSQKKKLWRVGLAIGLLSAFVLAFICSLVILMQKRRKRQQQQQTNEAMEMEGDEEIDFLHLPGMPTRFTYEELKIATDNFSMKLGEGGFGAVFRGALKDGMRIAVKLLGYKGQGMKEFLAEVETIGSIHHVNLVRLVGYCAEKFHRLLVYEYLSNGSLDKWIFYESPSIDFATKYKIIMDIAKGLAYLHEDCRNRIIHLDVKPQNVLLDEKFNAKLSDFGLSKLVERDQSQIFTTMRGTPGYIAPEWLSSMITEKVDVYSFGVVILETVSGNKILDGSRSHGSVNLLSMLKKVAEEDHLADIVKGEYKGEEAMKMLRVAIWCLQVDYVKRPSMSTVVKVLEGVIDVEPKLDYNFWVPTMPSLARELASGSSSTSILPSLLSGPR